MSALAIEPELNTPHKLVLWLGKLKLANQNYHSRTRGIGHSGSRCQVSLRAHSDTKYLLEGDEFFSKGFSGKGRSCHSAPCPWLVVWPLCLARWLCLNTEYLRIDIQVSTKMLFYCGNWVCRSFVCGILSGKEFQKRPACSGECAKFPLRMTRLLFFF